MAKTISLPSVDAFLGTLEKSGILPTSKLEAAREQAGGLGDARHLARQLVISKVLTNWQAIQILHGIHALRIGKYALCDQIGKGDYGRVYLAHHLQLERKVAIKTLSPRHAQQKAVTERFLSEARRVAALDHHNLIHVYDVDNDGDRYYTVMEYVQGRDLARIVAEDGPADFRKAALWIGQAARGLAHAHAHGLIHRAIQPANLIVDHQGIVKVLDFESGEIAQSQIQTHGADLAGIWDYASPEQARGAKQCDHRSDIYSLGATLYYLLAGRALFTEGTDEERRQRLITEAAPELTEIRCDIPASLNAICKRMMSKNPDLRFASADEVGAALEGWLDESSPPEATRVLGVAPSPSIASGAASVTTSIAAEQATSGPVAPAPGDAAFDSVVASGPVVIQTKRKRHVAAPAAAQAKAAGEPSEPAPTSAKKNRLLTVRIAIASICLVVLLGLGIGAGIWHLLPKKATQVAGVGQRQRPDASSTDVTVTPVTGTDHLETDPAADAARGAGPSNPSPAPRDNSAPPPDPATGGAAPPPTAPLPPGDAPAPSTPATNPATNMTPMPGAPASTPANPAPTAPALTTPAPTTPAPTTPTPTTPTPTTPAPDAPAPAPPEKVFEGFPAELELPDPAGGTGTPIPLGPIRVGPKALCIVKMLGGEKAIRGSRFGFRPGKNGTAERDWEVELLPGNTKEGAGSVIATFALADDQFSFQWTAAAEGNPAARHLCNCVLTMTAGADKHSLRLRTAKIMDPMKVNLDRAVSVAKWDVPFPPDPSAIRIEITKLSEGFPTHALDPGEPFPADKGQLLIRFGEKKEAQLIEFRVQTTLKRDLELKLMPFLLIPGAKATKLTKQALVSRNNELTKKQANLANELTNLKGQEGRVPAKQKEEFKLTVQAMQTEFDRTAPVLAAVAQLVNTFQAMDGGTIHVRLFYDVDPATKTQVDLLRCD